MQPTRRGFLASLLGSAVIVSLPGTKLLEQAPLPKVADWDVRPPPGMTYQWVRSALLGEPDPENVEKRLATGWKFVEPIRHPGTLVMSAERAIENHGLILMEKPTKDIDEPTAYDIHTMSVRPISAIKADAAERRRLVAETEIEWDEDDDIA